MNRIGTSGWSYPAWRGRFYPKDLTAPRQLEYASRMLSSIEINASFYRLQTPDTYRAWYDQTPRGFRFAVKGSRFITHNKKLSDTDAPMANFLASGVLLLREKLGPFVWQLPERLGFQPDRVDAFLSGLPRDTLAAARIARRHDARVNRRGWTRPRGRHRIRHALEVRNPEWLVPELVRSLRRHRVALVISDSADWPRAEEITAGFVYIRLHGANRTYASRYDDRSLDEWAARIRAWADGGEPRDAAKITDRAPPRRKRRDVYVYLDNDQHANAPNDALRLAQRLRAIRK